MSFIWVSMSTSKARGFAKAASSSSDQCSRFSLCSSRANNEVKIASHTEQEKCFLSIWCLANCLAELKHRSQTAHISSSSLDSLSLPTSSSDEVGSLMTFSFANVASLSEKVIFTEYWKNCNLLFCKIHVAICFFFIEILSKARAFSKVSTI